MNRTDGRRLSLPSSGKAVAADVNRRLLASALIRDVVPRTPVEPLTQGDSWNGFSLQDVPLDSDTSALQSAATATRPIDVWRMENELIAPADGVVVTRWSRKIVGESICNSGRDGFNSGRPPSQWLRQLTKIHPKSVSETASLLFAPGHRNYFHTYVDVFSRICAFGLPGLATTEVELLYHEPIGPLLKYLLDRLQPPNVTLRALDSPDLIRVEQLILPTFSSWRFSGWLPSWYLTQLRQALVPNRPSRRSERIYIARRGRRKTVNEEELLDRLCRHGFRPVELERLSFDEQIRLFHDAEAVVATHGAGLTNLLFASNALVVEIFPTTDVIPHYLMMAASLNHNYRYVLGTRALRWFDFETDPVAVEREVVLGLEALS